VRLSPSFRISKSEFSGNICRVAFGNPACRYIAFVDENADTALNRLALGQRERLAALCIGPARPESTVVACQPLVGIFVLAVTEY